MSTDGDGQRGVDRRTLLRGAVAAGMAAWTAPVILSSVTSPAAAASGGCRLYVLQVTRAGNSDNCKDLTVSSDPSIAATVTGLDDPDCPSFTRATTADLGLTTCSYASGTFSFRISSLIAGCKIIGVAQTNGTSSATPASGSVTMTAVTPVAFYDFSVPATDTNNVDVWVYVAVKCT